MIKSIVRPSIDSTGWTDYTRPYSIVDSNSNDLPVPIDELAVSTHLAQNVIGALYNLPRSQVFLRQDKATPNIEFLTLAIWSQQWARLRRSFLFCTGAIASRQFPGVDFDWQVIPFSAADEIKRENSEAVFIETEKISDIHKDTKLSFWLEAAVEDLYENCPYGLRSFLRIFGAEKSMEGETLSRWRKSMLSVNGSDKSRNPFGNSQNSSPSYNPAPEQGKRLKRAFFCTPTEDAGELARLSLDADESVLLKELVQTEHPAAFDADDLQIALGEILQYANCT